MLTAGTVAEPVADADPDAAGADELDEDEQPSSQGKGPGQSQPAQSREAPELTVAPPHFCYLLAFPTAFRPNVPE